MDTDRRTAQIDHDGLHLIFERVRLLCPTFVQSNKLTLFMKLYEKAVRRSEDDRHQAERQQRRLIDGLRSKIKHLDPPVSSNDTWEQVRARIQNSEEYRALDSDDLRRTAFEKVIRRLKEKEEDAEHERSRRERDRKDERNMVIEKQSSYRYHDRERDRSGHRRSGPHPSRLSKTPEPDAYEAERKKAQAEREKQYRKSSVGSPPYHHHHHHSHHRGERERERERSDRDRDRGSSRTASLSHYDRERREREEERERLYRTRGDPRGSRDELDYGGETRSSGGGSSRRRRRDDRDSDGESVGSRRDSKVRFVCSYLFLIRVWSTLGSQNIYICAHRTPRNHEESEIEIDLHEIGNIHLLDDIITTTTAVQRPC